MLDFDVADAKKIRVIIDSDTACEADDPFAIAHALMSPKLIVKAIVAEHFREPGSMEKSRQAAKRVTGLMGSGVPVLKGEPGPGSSGKVSEVILALSPDVEGRATAVFLSELLAEFPVKLTRPALGLPAGSNLSYADSATIGAAFSGRTGL